MAEGEKQALKAKLAEAQSIIDALRAGRVDAVVGEEQVLLLRLRETEEALRRSEARYRAVIEAQADLVFRWDLEGRLTFVNEAFCRFLRQPREQLVGGAIGPVLPPGGDHAHLLSNLAALGAERPYLEREHRMTDPDGDVRWLQLSHRLIRDDQGQPAEVQSVARDITERRRAQEQLRETNAALEQRVADRTAQLQELVRELGHAEQRERRHLAQFLHDDLQQLLVAAKLSLGALRTEGMTAAQRDSLEHARDLLTRSIAASRSLVSQLNPPALHTDGLVPALYWLADQMREIHRLPVHVQADPRAEPGTEHIRDLLFASVRELLFNVIKHAEASQAWLELRMRAGDTIELEVRDDGAGFDTDRSGDAGDDASFGLWSIEERLRLLDGGLVIDSKPGSGSRVLLTAPAAAPPVDNDQDNATAGEARP